MAVRIKVGEDHRIAIPDAVRKQLRIEPANHLLAEVRDGSLILVPKPSDYARRLRGLHREVWTDIDPDDYVRHEREAWQG